MKLQLSFLLWVVFFLILFLPFVFIFFKIVSFFDFDVFKNFFLSIEFINSFLISLVTSISVVIFSIIIALFFITNKEKLLFVFLIVLFGVSKYTYLSLFENFIHNDFLLVILINFLHYLPWGIVYFVFILKYEFSGYLYHFNKFEFFWRYFKFIVLKKIWKHIGFFLIFIFLSSFSSQEIASFLGIKNISEKIISFIMLTDNINQIFSIVSFQVILIFLLSFYLLLIDNEYIINRKYLNFSNLVLFENQKIISSIILSVFFILLLVLIQSLISKIFFQSLKIDENLVVFIKTLLIYTPITLFVIFLGELLIIGLKKFLKVHYYKGLFFFIIVYLLIPHSIIGFFILNFFGEIINNYYVLFFLGNIYISLPIVLIMLYLFQKRTDSFLANKLSTINYIMKVLVFEKFIIWIVIFFMTLIYLLNDLSITILLSPPGLETYIVKVYNLLHYGDYNTVKFLELVQILFVLISTGMIILLRFRDDKS
ncbi:hypothetical protein EDC58_1495 [Caminibacter pacificus]|uniref:Uncharacterized protein n=2 Tax=Caminibacter pacificus TaxID=1424653 RepID=A0AAJ4RC31_9BACT|nr:hypothetical protein EDC58_1495 [Caminibacter pacificus]